MATDTPLRRNEADTMDRWRGTEMDRERNVTSARWIAAVLTPISAAEFLVTYWRKRFAYCRGPAHRFSELLSWQALNRILEHHWRETYRFRLAKHGRDLDPASYADLSGYTPRIRSKDVTDHLRNGATMSFDAIDEVHEPLMHLAESFEAFFHGATKINIYAAWRTVHGLDLHRDNQEIFILQLDGRKRWLLYGDDVEGIDRSGLQQTSIPPDAALFDRNLEPGDLLYIPRGCYHVAVPMNEPTLHLTLGVKSPREIDLLGWLVERRRAQGAEARDLPCLGALDDRVQFSDELRAAIFEGLSRDLIEQYLLETGSNYKPRPTFSLPWSATPERLPAGRDFLVRLKGRLNPAADGESAGRARKWRSRGRTYLFPRDMELILEQLDDGASHPMDRLIDALSPRLDEINVRLLVTMLVKENLAAIEM